MKSIEVSLNLSQNFYRGIQCDKTCNFGNGKAFEVHHEIPILGVALKRHTKSITKFQFPSNFLLQSFNFHQISSVCHQSCVFDDSVNFYKLLN